MSVILDALKRVQDENRRREPGSEPEPTPESPEGPNRMNALLRRLAEPASGSEEENAGPAISSVVWISLGGIALVVLVAVGLWLMQPDFSGPQVNEGRPLLADLTGQGEPASRASTPAPGSTDPGGSSSGVLQERFGSGPGGDNGSGGDGSAGGGSGNGALGALAAGSRQDEGSESTGEDMSDLSGRLPAEGTDDATPTESTETADGDGSDSMLELQVEQQPAGRAPSSGGIEQPSSESEPDPNAFLDIRSARPGADTGGASLPEQRPWQPPRSVGAETPPTTPSPGRTESGRASVPDRLVDPGVRAAFAEGVQLQKAGDHHGAEAAYKRALERDPHNATINANLGVLYEREDRLALAERHLRKAVATEPDNASVHNNLGVVLYRQGKYDAALIEFNRTLALDPRHLDAYTNKGLIHTRWGQHREAERNFMQVLSIDPGNALAHYNLGLVYEEMGEIARAVDHYYEFLATGGAQHPEITSYLDGHLVWLEDRLQGSARR